MQQRRDDAAAVEPHITENGRDGQGVEDVGLTASAHLALMGFGAKQVGVVDGFDFLRIQILLDDREQIADQQPALAGLRGPLPAVS